MHINTEGIIVSYLRSGSGTAFKGKRNCKLLQKLINWFQKCQIPYFA